MSEITLKEWLKENLSSRTYWKGTTFLVLCFFSGSFILEILAMHWLPSWGPSTLRSALCESMLCGLCLGLFVPPLSRLLGKPRW